MHGSVVSRLADAIRDAIRNFDASVQTSITESSDFCRNGGFPAHGTLVRRTRLQRIFLYSIVAIAIANIWHVFQFIAGESCVHDALLTRLVLRQYAGLPFFGIFCLLWTVLTRVFGPRIICLDDWSKSRLVNGTWNTRRAWPGSHYRSGWFREERLPELGTWCWALCQWGKSLDSLD